MKRIISLFSAAVLLFSLGFSSYSAENRQTLSFKNGKFRILVLSDTQDDHHPAPDMLNFVKKSIEEAKPDLIVFTGDLVEDSRAGGFVDDEPFSEGVVVNGPGGELDKEKTFENVKTAIKPVLDLFQASGVPFDLVQGCTCILHIPVRLHSTRAMIKTAESIIILPFTAPTAAVNSISG